jgi:hypothetical protein
MCNICCPLKSSSFPPHKEKIKGKKSRNSFGGINCIVFGTAICLVGTILPSKEAPEVILKLFDNKDGSCISYWIFTRNKSPFPWSFFLCFLLRVSICNKCCFVELYDERSIRHHVKRSRELLSLSNLHVSLSSSLALQHEAGQQKTSGLYSSFLLIQIEILYTLKVFELSLSVSLFFCTEDFFESAFTFERIKAI